MSTLVADCPRCGSAQMTFDLRDAIVVRRRYQWQRIYEVPCICRHCHTFTVFEANQADPADDRQLSDADFLKKYTGSANDFLTVEGYVNLKNLACQSPPEFLSEEIEAAFREGATCLAVGCYNAAGAMFRMCVDMATRSLLPKEDTDGLNNKVRRDLGLRLPWMFAHGLLPTGLEELSHCVKEDGNDGVHAGILTLEDAADLIDFTSALLERIYTEPAKLKIAKVRRDARRQKGGD